MRWSIRSVVAGLAVGGLFVGSALAGGVISPPRAVRKAASLPSPDEMKAALGERPFLVRGAVAGDEEVSPNEIPGVAASDVTAPDGPKLPAGTFLVGAARASLYPTAEYFGGTTWQTSGCNTYGVDGDFAPGGDHLIPTVDPGDPIQTVRDIRGWPDASPDCVYLGGFGLGPVRPASRVGQGGVWIRTIAISNGEATQVYGIADLVGWFSRYDALVCTDCGIREVRERVAADTGLGVGDVIFGSTHAHAGADAYGGWGGLPTWYRKQIHDAAVASAKQAIANLEPAVIDVGEVHLRNRNNERRDTYYSTTDTGAAWVRARALDCTTTCTEGAVIATWGNYTGHPTIVSESFLHADWPGAAARRFEEDGGVGLLFEGGLGNVSVSGLGGATQEARAENTGRAIGADILADVAANPHRLASNDMVTATTDLVHPTLTNPGLTTLASVGLFDREFGAGTPGGGLPAAYHWAKGGHLPDENAVSELQSIAEEEDPEEQFNLVNDWYEDRVAKPGSGCYTAGPTITTTAGANRIGELLVAFAPGEIFSTIAEAVKERADNNAVAMVLGQTNDSLGYIIQSFEYDYLGGTVTEYGTRTGEYEEVFAIDHCFGDHVLETMLTSTRALGFGG